MSLSTIRQRLKQHQAALRLTEGQLILWGGGNARRDKELLALVQTNRDEIIACIKEGEAFDFTDTEHQAPPSLLVPGATRIAPSMLPLLALEQVDIDRIVASVPEGIDSIQDIYPLTPLQEGMLFHYLMDTAGDPYLMWSMLAFVDDATLDAYIDAFNQVIARHDILRTSLRWEGLAQPVQVVHRAARLAVQTLALAPGDGSVMDQLRQRFDPTHYRIDLRVAPLVAFVVARDETNDRWVAMQLSHHITTDRTAGDLTNAEIRAFMQGRGSELLPPVPYRNFVAKVHDRQRQADDKAYFTQLLERIEHTTAPFSLLNVHRDGSDIATVTETLGEEESKQLISWARAAGVGAATVLHVAWGHVLGRLCEIDTPVFGTVLFGRSSTGMSQGQVLGPAINLLPVVLDTRRTAVEALRQMREQLADLLLHEHAPLSLALGCARLPNELPLFTSVINYRRSAAEDRPLIDWQDDTDAKIVFLAGHEGNNYPLTLSIDDFGTTHRLTVQAARGIDADLVISLLRTSVHEIITALAQASTKPLSALPVLSAAYRVALLTTWTGDFIAYPDQCVHALFEAQVDRTPDAIAVRIPGGETFTYREIDMRANQMAHILSDRGIRPGTLVGLCLHRSMHQVVAMLGVFKAGGACLPLDPDYPRERLEYLIRDSQCGVAITTRALDEILGAAPVWRVLIDAAEVDARSTGRLNTPISLNDHAYVLYTSGSSGQPKGLIGSHRTLVSRLWPECARSTRDDIYAQKTAMNFIDSFWETWMPLLTGASFVIFPKASINDPAEFLRGLAAERISHLVLVPTLLSALVSQLESHPGALPALRYCVSSGEPLPQTLATRFLKLAPHVELVNIYGTTEFWDATAHRCSAHDPGAIAPLGRPLPNVHLYVLDRHLDIVPPGAEGELYISSPGLSVDYLNRAELTHRNFLSSPFLAGEKMYRTGDRVRWLAGHGLEYLGRADRQIKRHGHRIEPAEIETCLRALPDIGDAVVMSRQDATDSTLCAYVVPRRPAEGGANLGFGLFYFSDAGAHTPSDPLALYLETVRKADQLGFDAIWTPERHFTEVGAAFPNPSVLSAAAAMVTHRVQLRAGSVVLPLHSPIRVAEEWAVVDRLSNGRVALSFASGWVPNDFALSPDHFAQRHAVMMEQVEQVRTLWRGGTISARNGVGAAVSIRTQPRPVQPELQVWITAAGATRTFADAGRIGANVLTHVLNTTLAGLAEKIAVYRRTRQEAGFDPATGTVAVMLHTYVLEDAQAAQAEAYPHLREYFRSQLRLRQDVGGALGLQVGTDEDVTEEVVTLATERFLATKALIGSPTTCSALICELQTAGADEIACLVDFGISSERVLPALEHLDRLRRQTVKRPRPAHVRSQMANALPAPMIPDHVIVLDRLPLTPSGKIDAKALPAPTSSEGLGHKYVGPRSATEARLAEIWERVLRVKQVGIMDRFFDLGGNSIAAIRVINQARKELGLKISLRTLFERQTISALEIASTLEDEPQDQSPVLCLKRGGRATPLICFHGGAGTASFYSRLGQYLAPDVALYAFEYPPLLSGTGTYEDISALVRDFLPVIRRIQPSGPYQLLGWSFGGLTAYEAALQLKSQGDDVSFLCLIDAYSGRPEARAQTISEAQAVEYLLKMYRVAGDHEAIADAGHEALLGVLKSSDRVPESFSNVELDKTLSVIQDLLRMKSLYQPAVYDGRVTYVEACLEKDRSIDVMSPWHASAGGGLEVIPIKTSHFKLFDEEVMPELGAAVREGLMRAQTNDVGHRSSTSSRLAATLGSASMHSAIH